MVGQIAFSESKVPIIFFANQIFGKKQFFQPDIRKKYFANQIFGKCNVFCSKSETKIPLAEIFQPIHIIEWEKKQIQEVDCNIEEKNSGKRFK